MSIKSAPPTKDPLDAAEELRKRLVDGGLLQRNAHNVTEAIENLISARIDEALKQANLRF